MKEQPLSLRQACTWRSYHLRLCPACHTHPLHQMEEEGYPEAQVCFTCISTCIDWRKRWVDNNIRSTTAPPETSGSIIARPEHDHTDEAQDNNLMNNFKKMIEGLKEEMKNPLRQMEGKTNKITKYWKKSIQPSKKKGNQTGEENSSRLKYILETMKNTKYSNLKMG